MVAENEPLVALALLPPGPDFKGDALLRFIPLMLRAAPGLATICVTTAVGLVCSMLVKAQLVNLDYVLPR